MEKNFINYHVLISHSPSCLNRDDMNMQKTAIFGGKRRVRISSQSLKRTMRKSDYYAKNMGKESIRSRNLGLLKDNFLKELKGDYEEAIIHEALERFVKTKSKNGSEDENTDESDNTTEKKLAVAPWITEEFKILCQTVRETRNEGLSDDEHQKTIQKFEKQKGNKKKERNFFIDQALEKKLSAK